MRNQEATNDLLQWQDFGKQLPNGRIILNKAHTDVGGTQFFLKNEEKVILAVPRCSLIENKRSKHPDVWYYRDMSDNVHADGDSKKQKPKKKATYEDIRKYNEEVAKYIGNCYLNHKPPKVMVTYDSLHHIIDALSSISKQELTTWTLVIDEMQVIFGDSTFKSLTEMRFLEDSKCFKKAIFMSATPYLETYMEQLDEFKGMPYYELVWPKEMEQQAIITNITIKKGESRNKVCKKIIDRMRAGKVVKFGSKEINTSEAVFYINNVADILHIVKACKLKPSEVNILCSRSNKDRLKKAGYEMGIFPKEGDPHKPFTFATRSVYLGVDFNSECAYSYIFADPSQKTLALDISTDIPQILGRQRLERNPYRNEAILFFKENALGLDDKDFAVYIDKKKKDTNALIADFNSKPEELQSLLIKKYRTSMERDRYKNDYLMVVDDPKVGNPVVAFNTLYMLAEIRGWEISKKNFANQYSVIRNQQQAGITGITGTQSDNPNVLMFKETFEATKSTDKRISLYCDFRLHHPDLMVDVDFVSHKYADYWDALGYSNLKALGFQESRIKSALEEPSPFDTTTDEVILAIREKLEEKRYAVDKLKDELQKIYAKAGYQKKAKAKDIEKFLSAKSYQDSKSGKRYYDITSLFNKDVSLFIAPNIVCPAFIVRCLLLRRQIEPIN